MRHLTVAHRDSRVDLPRSERGIKNARANFKQMEPPYLQAGEVGTSLNPAKGEIHIQPNTALWVKSLPWFVGWMILESIQGGLDFTMSGLARGACTADGHAPGTSIDMRLAVMCSVCAGIDAQGRGHEFQVMRAQLLGENLVRTFMPDFRHNVCVDKVLLISGFSEVGYDLNTLKVKQWSMWDRVHDVPRRELQFMSRAGPNDTLGRARLWPGSGIVQNRKDGNCTSLKLHAFKLIEYAGVIMLDSDACFLEDPRPFIFALVQRNVYFSANAERAQRPYDGFNSHIFFFTPSKLMAQVLIDKARLGDFMPYTNSEQDVLESVFPPHLEAIQIASQYKSKLRALPMTRHRKHLDSCPR